MDATLLTFILVVYPSFLLCDKIGNPKSDELLYKKAIENAQHYWRFDEARSLYGIADKVTGKRGTIREGGAKLTRIGRGTGNKFLTLEGLGSSIELGRFDGCFGDIFTCTNGFTLSLWLRFRDVAGKAQYILGNVEPNSNDQGFVMLRTKDHEMQISYNNNTHQSHAKYAANTNEWMHHMITWNGERIIVYKNGKKLLEKTQTRRRRREMSSRSENEDMNKMRQKRRVQNRILSLGRHGFKIDADYDDVIVWEKILTEADAAVLYYGDLAQPKIQDCETNSSAACLSWSIRDDPFDRIRAANVIYDSDIGGNLVPANTTFSSQCIHSLDPLVAYTFTLQLTVKNVEKILRSNTIHCKTMDGIPSPPLLTIGKKSETSLEAIWMTPSPANGVITSYVLTVIEAMSKKIKLKFELNAQENSSNRATRYKVNVTNLQPGHMYTVDVKAISKIGKSIPATVTVATKSSMLVPKQFKVVPIKDGVIKVSWALVSNALSYRVFFKKINGKEYYVDVAGNSTLLDFLQPLTSYSIDIQPKFESGFGLRLRPRITVTTTDRLKAPTNVKATAINWNMIKVTWKPLDSKSILYLVYLYGDGHEFPLTTKHSSVTFKNLKPLVTYSVDIQAKFEWGLGPRVDRATVARTPGRPGGPTGVQATSVDWDKIRVTWNPSNANHTTYIVDVKSESGHEAVLRTKHSSVTFENLQPLTTYSVGIQTKFKWGLGPRFERLAVARTQDRNECTDSKSNRCDRNSDCFNVEGSYLCQCRTGYVGDGRTCRPIPANAKEEDFCEENEFRDVHWPRVFRGGAIVKRCPNGTVGFASRRCLTHHDGRSAVYELPNLGDCVSDEVSRLGIFVENPSSDAFAISDRMLKVTKAKQMFYGGDVRKTVLFYDITIQKKIHSTREVEKLKQSLLDIASNLLNVSMMPAWKDLSKDQRSDRAAMFLDSLEILAGRVSEGFGNNSIEQRFFTNNIDMKIQSLNHATKNLNFSGRSMKKNDFTVARSEISLPVEDILRYGGRRNLSVVFFSFANLNKIISVSSISSSRSRRSSWDILNSNIVSATVLGVGKLNFNSPVILVLPHLTDETVLNTSCVFWNISRRSQSRWLSTGCHVNRTDANGTVCHCYHLTNFAVLMTVSDMPAHAEVKGHRFTLRIISIIGLIISICAMTVAFLTFCCFGFLQGARTTYHKQLVASLIIANVLFLIGIDRTENMVVCKVIAILLHYFFIVAFVWMAMEGVLLYFMLKKIFSNRNFLKKKRFIVLCWVLPALYVSILCSLQLERYGNQHFCWISQRNGFVWSFVGPVILVLAINSGVMFHAFRVMCGKRQKVDTNGGFAEAWYWLKGCSVLTCLLGVTWILGVFYVDNNTVAFAYLFTICNALQGLFIFIFHCAIDSRVRCEYIRLLKCQKRYEYNEKAGYSSSMKFRKWSGSVKSIGSLDRSLSHSSAKRTKSDSLDRSLLRQYQNNDSISENGRYTILRSISSMKSNRSEKSNGHIPERELLFKNSIEFDTTLKQSINGQVPNGIHSLDEQDGESYSSVFESENEDKGKAIRPSFESGSINLEDEEKSSEEQRLLLVHQPSSESSVDNQISFDEIAESDDMTSLMKSSTSFGSNSSFKTPNLSKAESCASVQSDEICELVRNSTYSLQLDCLDSLSARNEREVESEPAAEEHLIEDQASMSMDMLLEEEQTFLLLDDKRISMHFGKLNSITEEESSSECHSCSLSESTANEKPDIKKSSYHMMNRKIEFEVEDLPKIEDDEVSTGRRSGTPDKKRTETTLRIGVPRMISVSSVDSEPISPIIISIDPDDQELDMLEAEIQFEDESFSS